MGAVVATAFVLLSGAAGAAVSATYKVSEFEYSAASTEGKFAVDRGKVRRGKQSVAAATPRAGTQT